MKVLYLSSWERSNDGGSSRVAFEIAQEAHQAGIKSAIIYPGIENKVFIRDGVTNITIESIIDEDFAVPSLTLDNYKFIISAIKDFSPNIIHSHTEAFIGIIGQIYAIENDIPIVLTSHMLPSQISNWQPVSSKSSELLYFAQIAGIIPRALKTYYENCDAVIALNNQAKNDIRKFGYNGEIYIIPNGRNISKYKMNRNRNKKQIERLVFTGQISERKNQKYLIEVMKFLPKNYTLELIGSQGNKEEVNRIKEEIKNSNLQNIKLTDKTPFSEVIKKLYEADVFVSASTHEVQSLAVIEALLTGLPVIGLKNVTIDELVSDNNGSNLAANTSPKLFAKEILKIRSDNYKLLSINAEQSVTHLNWTEVMKKTISIYEREISKDEVKRNSRKRNLEKLVKIIPSPNIQNYINTTLNDKTFTKNIKNVNKGKNIIKIIGLISSVVFATFLLSKRQKKD